MELPRSHEARLQRLAHIEGHIDRLRRFRAEARARGDERHSAQLAQTIATLEASRPALLAFTEEMRLRDLARRDVTGSSMIGVWTIKVSYGNGAKERLTFSRKGHADGFWERLQHDRTVVEAEFSDDQEHRVLAREVHGSLSERVDR